MVGVAGTVLLTLAVSSVAAYSRQQEPSDMYTPEEYEEYAEVYGDAYEDVHPQLHTTDICGSWHEVGSCYTMQCDVKKFNRVSAQYTTKPMDGKMTPHDPAEHEWQWYDYVQTQQEYDRDYCGNSKHEVFSMIVLGEFALPPEMHKSGWTEIEQLPHSYRIAINETYNREYTQLWPSGECANALEFLNEKCPCGGEWKEGTIRTITMDFGPDAPNADICHAHDPDCHVCHREECEGLYNLRIQGNIQMPGHDTIYLASTVAAHDAHPPDGYESTHVEHQLVRNVDDGQNGYNGCKTVYPQTATNEHHDGKEARDQAHQTEEAYNQKSPDYEEDKQEEHHQEKVHVGGVDVNPYHHHHEDHHHGMQVQAESMKPSSSSSSSSVSKLHQVLKRQSSAVSTS